jgi:ADP-ribose pyrophosphatase
MSEIKVLKSTKLNTLGKYSLEVDEILLPNGVKSSHYSVIHPGAVVILALDDSKRVLLIEQYRHSIKRNLLEIPAGTLEVNEDILTAANRELAEETGFRANKLISLGAFHPVPGFCSEVQHFYFANELEPFHADKDPDEIINLKPTKISEIDSMILSGEITDSKTIVAIYIAKSKGLI